MNSPWRFGHGIQVPMIGLCLSFALLGSLPAVAPAADGPSAEETKKFIQETTPVQNNL